MPRISVSVDADTWDYLFDDSIEKKRSISYLAAELIRKAIKEKDRKKVKKNEIREQATKWYMEIRVERDRRSEEVFQK